MTTDARHDTHDADGLLAQAVVDPAVLAANEHAQHVRRRRQRFGAAAVAFVVFVLIAALAAQVGFSDTPTAGTTAPKVAVKAEALGVLVLRPGREPERFAAAQPVVGAATTASGAHASYVLAGIATVERSATSATVQPGARRAAARAAIERISLFDGRIELTGSALDATARSSEGRASGALALAPTTKLTIDGTPTPITPNQQVAIEGVGTVSINEQAVLAAAPTGDEQTGPRYRTVGAIAHVRITQAVGDLPAGTELIIGRVDAGVREGKVREIDHPAPGSDATPPLAPISTTPGSPLPGIQTGTPKPGESTLPRRPVAVRGNAGGASAPGLQDYLFPVLGTSNFSNDWGAPRASTGIPHQGTDIFAEEGTPIVAVADGVLDRVGWNSIGGYRFWLFDQYGNSFYHAHLSAFSPLAQDGARVRRGDVIGFVGHTGDAQYTPPHLHFEIHPGNGAATNPYPFLGAWKQGIAVAIGLLAGGTERVAPLALLGFTDISANSGLQDSVLDTVPDTRARSIEQEREARPTDESLSGALDGPGTSAR